MNAWSVLIYYAPTSFETDIKTLEAAGSAQDDMRVARSVSSCSFILQARTSSWVGAVLRNNNNPPSPVLFYSRSQHDSVEHLSRVLDRCEDSPAGGRERSSKSLLRIEIAETLLLQMLGLFVD